MNIIETSLSVRVKNVLRRNGIQTIDELISTDRLSIEKMENLGVKSINEIFDFIDRYSIDGIDSNKTILNLPFAFFQNPNRSLKYSIEQNIDNVREIKFIDGYNLKSEIDVNNLSVRARNVVNENKLNNIDTLIELSINSIKNLKNLGKKSYEEIFHSIIENIIVITAEKKVAAFDSLLAFILVSDMKSYIDYKQSKILFEKLKNYSQEKVLGDKYPIDELAIDGNHIVGEIGLNFIDNFDINENIIEGVLRNSHIPLNITSIKNKLPVLLKEVDILSYINKLNEKDKIKLTTEGIEYKNPGIVKIIVRKFDEKKAKILLLRLEGSTLEEIAEKFDFTRERSRQIIAKEMPKINERVFEDRYKEAFQKYNIDKHDFINIFDTSNIEYNYLNLKYEHGNRELEEMLSDEEISESIRMRVKTKLEKGYIVIDDNKIKANRIDIIRYLSKTYAENNIRIKEFYDLYQEFLKNQGLDINEFNLDTRYLENRIADAKFTVSLPGKRFRFYKYKDYDWDRFYNEINIEKYEGKEISTLIIYREQLHLMRMYDIRNEYELHNIMKKRKDYNEKNIEFGRNPTLRIGDTDRDEQVISLFLTHTPIRATELAKLYEDEYGVKSQTAQGTHFKCIQQHLYNGEYVYEKVELTLEEVVFLENFLSEAKLYFIEDIKNNLISKGISENRILELVTPITMERFNFRVYSSYLLPFEYVSMSAYIDTAVFNKDIVDLNKYDRRIYNIGVVWSKIREYNEKLKFIEFDEKKYINIQRLEKAGFTKQYFEEKLEIIYEDMNEDIISLDRIKNYFDDSNINDFGFNDIFFISLLRSHENIYYQKFGDGYIIRKNNSDLRLINIIDLIVNQYKIINVYDLIDIINDEYAIQIEKFRITESIKDTEIYYDEIMEKVYIDEGYYYEEFDD